MPVVCEYDNEEGQVLHKNESEIEGDRYILLSSLFPLSPLQKESNRLLDLGKKTKSLIYFICISKNW